MKKMKLSELKIEELTPEQEQQLILQGIPTEVSQAPKDEKITAALILGATAKPILRRTQRALELYQKGYAQYILLSGGEGWKRDGDEKRIQERINMIREYIPDAASYSDETLKKMTEAEFMRLILWYAGVPDEAFIMEHYSTNTKENMENISFLLDTPKAKENLKIERVIIITDTPYGIRSLLTAKKQQQNRNHMELVLSTIKIPCNQAIIHGEVERLKKYSAFGNLEDASVNIENDGTITLLQEQEEIERS